jgi:hypothetical protein
MPKVHVSMLTEYEARSCSARLLAGHCGDDHSRISVDFLEAGVTAVVFTTAFLSTAYVRAIALVRLGGAPDIEGSVDHEAGDGERLLALGRWVVSRPLSRAPRQCAG